jgi:hypothetical protein
MLNCRKCKCQIENRVAHQSYYDLESAIAAETPAGRLQHRVRMLGPLCDACLSDWRLSREISAPHLEIELPDHRSRAIRELDAACLRLAADGAR